MHLTKIKGEGWQYQTFEIWSWNVQVREIFDLRLGFSTLYNLYYMVCKLHYWTEDIVRQRWYVKGPLFSGAELRDLEQRCRVLCRPACLIENDPAAF